jgi:hypothetical protein
MPPVKECSAGVRISAFRIALIAVIVWVLRANCFCLCRLYAQLCQTRCTCLTMGWSAAHTSACQGLATKLSMGRKRRQPTTFLQSRHLLFYLQVGIMLGSLIVVCLMLCHTAGAVRTAGLHVPLLCGAPISVKGQAALGHKARMGHGRGCKELMATESCMCRWCRHSC